MYLVAVGGGGGGGLGIVYESVLGAVYVYMQCSTVHIHGGFNDRVRPAWRHLLPAVVATVMVWVEGGDLPEGLP